MSDFGAVDPISQIEAMESLASGDPVDVCKALVAIAFHESDWRWAQDRCLELLRSSDPSISGLAATCLGHIARIHRKIDKDIVLPALQALRADPDIGGRVDDAIDDISMFA